MFPVPRELEYSRHRVRYTPLISRGASRSLVVPAPVPLPHASVPETSLPSWTRNCWSNAPGLPVRHLDRRLLSLAHHSFSVPVPCTGDYGFRETLSSALAALHPLFTSGGLVLVSVLLVFVMVGWRDGVLGWWHCCCGNGCGMLSTCPVRRSVVHCRGPYVFGLRPSAGARFGHALAAYVAG